MNRRDFFKFAAAPVALAAIPLVIPHARKIFLPPKHGWFPSRLGAGYMREVEQYLINVDELRYRYDAIGRDIWGNEEMFHVETCRPAPEIAAQLIHDRFRHEGLIALRPDEARYFRMLLPNASVRARYV